MFNHDLWHIHFIAPLSRSRSDSGQVSGPYRTVVAENVVFNLINKDPKGAVVLLVAFFLLCY